MEDKNIERLIPTRLFCSLQGLNEDNIVISYLNRTVEEEELDNGSSIIDMLKAAAIKANNKVVYINVITIIPLAFKVVNNVEIKVCNGRDMEDRQYGR